MGVDFTAYFRHELDWGSLCNLPALLNKEWPGAFVQWSDGFLEAYPHLFDQAGEWQWSGRAPCYSSVGEEVKEEGYTEIDGPGGFDCLVGVKLIELAHVTRWYNFLNDNEHRELLRNACRTFAKVVAAGEWVYLPDSSFKISAAYDFVMGKKGWSDLRKFLQEVGGPPAMRIEDILEETAVKEEGEGYFIERAPECS